MEQVTLDKNSLQVLSVDTRIAILKTLDSKSMTLTEISSDSGLAKSTVYEHLMILMNAGLIRRCENGNKWVYYILTGKAKNILHPHDKMKIVILLSSSLFTLIVGVSGLYRFIKGQTFLISEGTIFHDPVQFVLGEIFFAITFTLWYLAFRLWKRSKSFGRSNLFHFQKL